MKKPRIYSTTPAASQPAVLAIIAAMLFAVYCRLPWPFLLLVVYFSYLMWNYWWTSSSGRATTVKEEPSCENIFPGETFDCRYNFTSSWFLPLVRCGLRFYLPSQVECSSDAPLATLPYSDPDLLAASDNQLPVCWNLHTVEYSWLEEGRDFSVNLQVRANMRGYYYLPPVHFFAGDPAGLYQSFQPAGPGRYLRVFPRLRDNEGYHKMLALQENTKDDVFGAEDRTESLGIRDFQPNDPPKSINWYATARTNTLKTNIYQRKDSAFCLVVFDLTAPYQPVVEPDIERREDPDLEDAIGIVCQTALSHLEQGFFTGFLTNAPLISWKKKEHRKITDIGVYQMRTRKITALEYEVGDLQEQNILQLCSAIDDTARAAPADQEKLWSFVREAPANSVIYIFGYHTPPERWQYCNSPSDFTAGYDPAGFYTPQRLAELTCAQVRIINLSKRGGIP